MKKYILIILFLLFSFLVFSENIKIKSISISIPTNYSFSLFNGDSEEFTKVIDKKTKNDINLVFFLKNGSYPGEYGPGASDTQQLENYLNGKSKAPKSIWAGSYRKTKLNSKHTILDTIQLSEFVIFDIKFRRQFLFTDSKYCYIVTVTYLNQESIMPEKMPDYFIEYNKVYPKEKNTNKVFIRKKLDNIYLDFSKHIKLPEYLQSLIDASDIVLNNITFIE